MARLLLLLAPAQLISWGTLYYAITFLAKPIQADTGWGSEAIFLAFSIGLLVSGLVAAPAGQILSRLGGRRVLVTGSALAATALLVIGLSQTLAVFTVGWVLAGAAMALTQYEAAFSTLRQLLPQDFRRAVGWIAVTGALASTIFWPLTHALTQTIGWRSTVGFFAALHLFPALFLHLRLPTEWAAVTPERPPPALDELQKFGPTVALLATAFSMTAIVTATVSAHAQILLETIAVEAAHIPILLAAIGPMQMAGRLCELAFARRFTLSAIAVTATLLLLLSVLLLGWARPGPGLLLLFFPIAYGFANGILTVVRGGLPVELIPHADYARALGRIAAPALIARALAPALAGWLIGILGARFIPSLLTITAVVAVAAMIAAVMIAPKRR